MSNPNFEVENERIRLLLQDIGRTLKRAMPEGWGFALFISDFHEDTDPDKGSLFYLSTIERESMIKVLQEFIRKEKEG